MAKTALEDPNIVGNMNIHVVNKRQWSIIPRLEEEDGKWLLLCIFAKRIFIFCHTNLKTVL